MDHLDDSAIRILKVLEEHHRLELLQIVSLAELSISRVKNVLPGLLAAGLVTGIDDVFTLNAEALDQQLSAAAGELLTAA